MKRIARLNGVFPLYKPKNLTSTDCCNFVKSRVLEDLNISKVDPYFLKVGHGGTLDKDAMGVLTIGIGSGCTKLTEFIHGPKTYVCHSFIGLETDTGYITGTKTDVNKYAHVTEENFLSSLKQFVGNILQAPPVYSALKYKGRRLSDMVEAGEDIPPEKLVPRPVKLYSIKCLMFAPPNFTLEISCGGGFYVRSIVRDLCHDLGTCATLTSLERTVHGSFSTEQSLDINSLNYGNILSNIQVHKYISDNIYMPPSA